MSEAKRNKDGIILPRVPKRIEAALAHLRAMTEPYFDGDTADAAEQALRQSIADHLKHVKPRP